MSPVVRRTDRREDGPKDTSKEAPMSTTETRSSGPNVTLRVNNADLDFEVVVIPVSDIDRVKNFYGRLGWRLDADFPFDNGFRIVEGEAPGSRWLVAIGTQMTLS